MQQPAIICVMKTGGDYDHRWTKALELGTWNHSSGRRQFICLTDDMKGANTFIEFRPLLHKWPGWYSKIELFRPFTISQGRRVIYFDLDTVIIGDLDPILETAAKTNGLIILRDFYRGSKNPNAYQSSVMAWTAGELDHLYHTFAKDTLRHMADNHNFQPCGGDQTFIETHAPGAQFWQDLCPGKIVSYKVDCKAGPPPGAAVVVFHGKPRPNEVNSEWVRRQWTLATS